MKYTNDEISLGNIEKNSEGEISKITLDYSGPSYPCDMEPDDKLVVGRATPYVPSIHDYKLPPDAAWQNLPQTTGYLRVLDALTVYKLTPNAIVPKKATEQSACMDLSYCADHVQRITVYNTNNEKIERHKELHGSFILHPKERVLLPTGLIMVIKPGFFVQVFPRSGISLKKGLTLINSVGIIDADYREEAMIPLVNHSAISVVIMPGDRLCQIHVSPVAYPQYCGETLQKPGKVGDRDGGFGSTGLTFNNLETTTQHNYG